MAIRVLAAGELTLSLQVLAELDGMGESSQIYLSQAAEIVASKPKVDIFLDLKTAVS